MERRSPYPGLQPFFAGDLAFFGGRDRDVRLVVASLFASPLTLLYGPSGVGKSSVLHAGVLPQLAERSNVVVVTVREWAPDPVRSIGEAAAACAGAGEFRGDLGATLATSSGDEQRRAMLVLDQFEDALAGPAIDEALVDDRCAALLRPGLRLETLAALGGADGIVRRRVRGALDGMAAGDRDLAAAALDRLVTPSGARIAHLVDDLARYAGSDAATVRPLLEDLSSARVLR